MKERLILMASFALSVVLLVSCSNISAVPTTQTQEITELNEMDEDFEERDNQLVYSYDGINQTDNAQENDAEEIVYKKLLYSGKNYKVYDISNNHQPEYLYEIYNEHGDIVKSEVVWRTSPSVVYISNNTLLSITVRVGTGTYFVQYYNVPNDMFSQVYASPILSDYGKVVYPILSDSNIKLVVSDIFDHSAFYKEFDLDFSPSANPADALRDAEFLDENTLRIVYLSGSEYEEESVILYLARKIRYRYMPLNGFIATSQTNQDTTNTHSKTIAHAYTYDPQGNVLT